VTENESADASAMTGWTILRTLNEMSEAFVVYTLSNDKTRTRNT